MIKLTGFAEECYTKYTLEKIIKDIRSKTPKKTECQKWKLTETEWRNSLWLALLKRLKNIAEGIPNEMQLKLPLDSAIKQDINWLSEF